MRCKEKFNHVERRIKLCPPPICIAIKSMYVAAIQKRREASYRLEKPIVELTIPIFLKAM